MTAESKYRQLQNVFPNVSRETFERLLAFEALFLKWSKSFNLAAPSTLETFWMRHVLDSVQLATIRSPSGVWIDLGSGGGLPGIVMAILMRDTPGGMVHLVESNGKKSAFLRNAVLETGAAGCVHQCRIEESATEIPEADVVTARALAALPALMTFSEAWLDGGAIGLFHKGREYREEIKLARDAWQFDLIEHKSLVDPESAILEISLHHARNRRRVAATKEV
jgi:16S rRNA (guanine527-N7)-methyltransferase